MNVAFFGGSFDPPHVGHVSVVRWLLSRDDIDRVLVVPCFAHAFAKPSSSFNDRLEMCRLAFGPLGDRVDVSNVESTIPAPSYTVDTLSALSAAHPDWRLRLVIGSDIPAETAKWKDFDRVSEIAPPIVLNRAGHETVDGAPVFPRVSSTNLRRRFAAGLPRGDLLPDAVETYIVDHDLYRLVRANDIRTSTEIVIVGCGRVGTALALAFAARNRRVTVVDSDVVLAAREFLPHAIVRRTSIAGAIPLARAIWFICTGDQAVGNILAQIDRDADPILDCCAVTSATAPVVDRLSTPVCRTHPLRAFPPADAGVPLPADTVFAVQGAPAAVVDILVSVRARCFELGTDHVALYHAAAVLASNLPGALAYESAAMFAACGVPDPESAVFGLMRSMLDNLDAGGFMALSGPAARGDRATVATDQAAADAFSPEVGQVHRILSEIIDGDIFGRRESNEINKEK